jgi:CubicO group peptidase (beta-lactamase class C family)
MPSGFEAGWEVLVADQRARLDSVGIVGATVALVHDGEIAAVDYYGMEDLESGRSVDERTLYHWASITKTFTAVAVMQLRDRGLLTLDDPVVRYVSELRGVYDPFGSMEDVTIRHLLSHSAGYRNATFPWDSGEPWQPFEPTEWSQLVAMIPYTEILFEPGSRFSYSNPGLIFAGRTIEYLSGDVYEAHIEKNIFRPLGMESAYFDLTPWHMLEDRSNSYRIVRGEPIARGLDFNTGITVSNSGLNATVADLARWMGFLMGAPEGRRDAYDRVLARGSLEEMLEPVVPVPDSSAVSPLGPVDMGLSFFLYEGGEAAGGRLVGHTGTQQSFRSLILFDPAADVGFIAVYNTAGVDETDPDTEAILAFVSLRAARELFPLFGSSP